MRTGGRRERDAGGNEGGREAKESLMRNGEHVCILCCVCCILYKLIRGPDEIWESGGGMGERGREDGGVNEEGEQGRGGIRVSEQKRRYKLYKGINYIKI